NAGFHTGEKDKSWKEFHTGEISGNLHSLHPGDKAIEDSHTGSCHPQDYMIQTGKSSVYAMEYDTESAGFTRKKREQDNDGSIAIPLKNLKLYNNLTEVPESSVVLEDYPCNHCKRIFPTLACMEYHTQVVHKFFCDVCNARIEGEENVESHGLKHKNSKLFQCPLCYKMFNSSKGLRHHNSKLLQCKVCNRRIKKGDRTRHMRIHLKPTI
ncbi:unnamed protein product, partial [Owenia fusiformis]